MIMEEKKLTDEEIVKALECCATISVNPYLRGECIDCPYFQKHIDCVEGRRSEMDCIDLIHRLKDENESLKKREKIADEDLNNVSNEWANCRDENAKLKAEIERLTAEINQRRERMSRMDCNYATELQKKAKLQKQVDELKTENKELYKEHTTLIAGSILKQQDIVKDTAREILQELYDQIDENTPKWVGVQIKIIAKRKGVEVE